MSSLAHIAAISGYSVSGSDRRKTPLTERLEKEGIKISYRHSAENVEGADMFVYTVAISPDNPEYMKALELGIPAVSRADFSFISHTPTISKSSGKVFKQIVFLNIRTNSTVPQAKETVIVFSAVLHFPLAAEL